MRHIFAFCVSLLAQPLWAEPVAIFAGALDFTPPEGFAQGFQHEKGAAFLREYVPQGESVEAWSQMVTLTGAQGAAAMGPEGLAQQMAEGFHAVCPDSLTTLRLDDPQVAGARAVFAAFLGCGNNGEGQSEAMVLLVLAGESDLYTLQWAEIGPQGGAPSFDPKHWYPRLSALSQVRICAHAC